MNKIDLSYLLTTSDPKEWAKAFIEVGEAAGPPFEVDEEYLTTWFSNAMTTAILLASKSSLGNDVQNRSAEADKSGLDRDS